MELHDNFARAPQILIPLGRPRWFPQIELPNSTELRYFYEWNMPIESERIWETNHDRTELYDLNGVTKL